MTENPKTHLKRSMPPRRQPPPAMPRPPAARCQPPLPLPSQFAAISAAGSVVISHVLGLSGVDLRRRGDAADHVHRYTVPHNGELASHLCDGGTS